MVGLTVFLRGMRQGVVCGVGLSESSLSAVDAGGQAGAVLQLHQPYVCCYTPAA